MLLLKMAFLSNELFCYRALLPHVITGRKNIRFGVSHLSWNSIPGHNHFGGLARYLSSVSYLLSAVKYGSTYSGNISSDVVEHGIWVAMSFVFPRGSLVKRPHYLYSIFVWISGLQIEVTLLQRV